MTNEQKYDKARILTDTFGQRHLLKFYGDLNGEQQEALLDGILRTDFALIARLYGQAGTQETDASPKANLAPLDVIDKGSLAAEALQEAQALGMDAIRTGQYAVVTMAGGEGSRLGHNGPKGTYRIQLDREKTLFEVQFDRIAEMSREAGAAIPWYIMTSEGNHEATVAYFRDHEKYASHPILFFQQGQLPMVDFGGKIFLREKHALREGPDGNGTIFKNMVRTGVASDMRSRGVKWFFVCNVDNIMAQCADPVFIGVLRQTGLLCGSKSVMKCSPEEKVGVFCRKNGRPGVIEYSELPPALARLTSSDGRLAYADGHISCSLFHTDVLGMQEIEAMPYHVARKKTPYLGDDGELVSPETENAMKFESFIFDVFPFFTNIAVLRVDREEEFAPVKNASGADSPDTARDIYLRHMRNHR